MDLFQNGLQIKKMVKHGMMQQKNITMVLFGNEMNTNLIQQSLLRPLVMKCMMVLYLTNLQKSF